MVWACGVKIKNASWYCVGGIIEAIGVLTVSCTGQNRKNGGVEVVWHPTLLNLG